MSRTRREPTLIVVDPSSETAEVEGTQRVVGDWGERVCVLRPVLDRRDPASRLPDPSSADGIVLLGSRASVYERSAWADAISEWVRPILVGELEIPLLGICYGHQLIAHLAGGAVADVAPDGAKRVGIERSSISESRLLGRASRSLRVVVSHREHVVSLPSGYRVVARREGVPFDGFEHSELPVFGFQFHPEARREFAVRAGIALDAIDEALERDGDGLLAAFRARARQRFDERGD